MTNGPSTSAEVIRQQFVNDIENNWARIEGNISTLDNWVLATLVALNGGAAIALASAAKDLQNSVLWPAICFVAGSVLAVLGAMVRSARERAFLNALLEERHAVLDPPDGAPVGSPTFASWIATNRWRAFRPTSARTKLPPVLVGLSLGAYVVGCTVLVASWQPKPQSSQASKSR